MTAPTAKQEGDVLLYHSEAEGDINLVDVGGTNIVVQMTPDFDTMAYLILFGGNVEDPGGDDKSQQWWGNFSEPDGQKHYRGEFQYLLEGLPATSGNLRLLEAAAQRDFDKAFVQSKIADTVKVTATIPAINRLNISIEIEANGKKSAYQFTENWESSIQ